MDNTCPAAAAGGGATSAPYGALGVEGCTDVTGRKIQFEITKGDNPAVAVDVEVAVGTTATVLPDMLATGLAAESGIDGVVDVSLVDAEGGASDTWNVTITFPFYNGVTAATATLGFNHAGGSDSEVAYTFDLGATSAFADECAVELMALIDTLPEDPAEWTAFSSAHMDNCPTLVAGGFTPPAGTVNATATESGALGSSTNADGLPFCLRIESTVDGFLHFSGPFVEPLAGNTHSSEHCTCGNDTAPAADAAEDDYCLEVTNGHINTLTELHGSSPGVWGSAPTAWDFGAADVCSRHLNNDTVQLDSPDFEFTSAGIVCDATNRTLFRCVLAFEAVTDGDLFVASCAGAADNCTTAECACREDECREVMKKASEAGYRFKHVGTLLEEAEENDTGSAVAGYHGYFWFVGMFVLFAVGLGGVACYFPQIVEGCQKCTTDDSEAGSTGEGTSLFAKKESVGGSI